MERNRRTNKTQIDFPNIFNCNNLVTETPHKDNDSLNNATARIGGETNYKSTTAASGHDHEMQSQSEITMNTPYPTDKQV